MKPAIFAAATLLEIVAISASACSVLILFDGVRGLVAAAAVLAVITAGWWAAMSPKAKWPLPTAWHYACKIALFVFAAEVLFVFLEGVGIAFLVAALVVEPLLVHHFGLPGERPRRLATVSLSAGLDA